MKDALLIDSELPNHFQAKAIEMANYFQNCLSIKTKYYKKLILEEKQSNKRQDISYIKIFYNEVLINILKKKRNKSNYQYI